LLLDQYRTDVEKLQSSNIEALFNTHERSLQNTITSLNKINLSLRDNARDLDQKQIDDTRLSAINAQLDNQRNILDLLPGVMIWNAGQDSAKRQWLIKQSLIANNDILKDNEKTLNDIESMIPELKSQSANKNKVENLQERLESIGIELNQLNHKSNQMLQSLVEQVLAEQKQSIKQQLAQVNFAQARLMDQLFIQSEISTDVQPVEQL
jgi:hypothetical protein